MTQLAKKTKLTYKTLFGYSLVVITLLLVTIPVFARNRGNATWFDFSFNTQTGQSPQLARTLAAGVNVDHLSPGEERWYIYHQDSPNAPNSAWVSLALRYNSEALLTPEQVNFQVMPQEQPISDKLLGQGSYSPLKSNGQNLTELFWNGQLVGQENYYVRVFNRSPFNLDVTLEATSQQPAVVGAIPASFNETAPARPMANPLEARQLRWTLTAQAVQKMNAEQATTWLQNAQSVGWLVTQETETTPKAITADPNMLWNLVAQAIAGQDAAQSAQWLIQADALGWLTMSAVPQRAKDLASKSSNITDGTVDTPNASTLPVPPPVTPQPSTRVPVSIYPNQPLEFNFNQVNKNRLSPYSEHWYSLALADLSNQTIKNLKLTMFSTPSDGFIDSRVNFEIFPANQYQIWSRGTPNDMSSFGVGLWVSRDKDTHTGERLWSGSVVNGDRYFIKIKNDSPVVIDYYLFAGDIQNTELGMGN